MTRGLRLDVDPWLEAPRALAPLIDPNIHSCGTVPSHGVSELSHPEPDFYTVCIKSYGRAPTFLLVAGYEQVRSVVAAIFGDWDAARRLGPSLSVQSISLGRSYLARQRITRPNDRKTKRRSGHQLKAGRLEFVLEQLTRT